MKKVKLLIDADILCYEIGFTTQTEDDEGVKYSVSDETLVSRIEDKVSFIIENAKEEMMFTLGDCEFLEPTFFLTGKSNFRYDVAVTDPYKGNRIIEKPINYRFIRETFVHKYNAIIAEGVEADDEMMMQGTEYREQGIIPVIVSRDKDLRQTSGYFYSWETTVSPSVFHHEEGLGSLELSQKKALKGFGKKWLYAQILVGDSTDNYKGCPKIGAVKAYNLLKDLESEKDMQQVCLEQFEKNVGEFGKERMEEQANLAFILTHRGSNWKWLL